MKTIIYHNPRCSNSREALSLLEKSNEDFEVIEYLKHAPSIEELTKILSKLKLKPEELVRKKEALYKEKFEGKKYTDKQWIEILCNNPVLIERPLVVKGNKAIIGRPPRKILEIL